MASSRRGSMCVQSIAVAFTAFISVAICSRNCRRASRRTTSMAVRRGSRGSHAGKIGVGGGGVVFGGGGGETSRGNFPARVGEGALPGGGGRRETKCGGGGLCK